MDSAIAIVTFICLAVEVLKRIGFGTLSGLLYSIIYGTKDLSNLKKDILTLQNELQCTSAMDEFAKWAKIRRELDAVSKKYQDSQSSESYKKLTVNLKVRSGLWVLTSIMHAGCSIYFRTAPMFYMPKLLGPANDYLHLPFAPNGSVSVVVWYYVVKHSFNLAADILAPAEKLKEE
eukprot:NODE_55_length_26219_cov_0.194908.p14 type:complete len:176 gc:universal NODE_55_length_26219_cov_0.194908:15448-14921(-)